MDGQRTVAGQVVATGLCRASQGVQDGPGHVFVPDKNKGAVAATDGDQARLLEQRRDLVVDLLTKDGADAQHGLQQRGPLHPELRQHLFHQAFVVGIGKHLVAAQRIGLSEPGRVVGVVTIGRTTGRHHHMAHTAVYTGVQHVAGAVHIHRIFKRAVGVFARRHDGREVHHGVDLPCSHRVHQRRRTYILHLVHHTGHPPVGGHLTHVLRKHGLDARLLCERLDHTAPHKTVGPRN